jgi:hypothetical protein
MLKNNKHSIKKYKKTIVNFIINLLRKLNLPDYFLAKCIRTFHFVAPYYLMKFMYYSKSVITIIFILFLPIFIFFMFIIFDGCLLASIEYEIDKKNFACIDPYLYFFNIEITNENRKFYSIISNIQIFIVIILIFSYRFLFTNLFFDEYN